MVRVAQKKGRLKIPASSKNGTATQECNEYKLWVSLHPDGKSDVAPYTIKE